MCHKNSFCCTKICYTQKIKYIKYVINNLIICEKKDCIVLKMSNISLPFGLIRKEKKSLIYQKTMKQVNTLENYISKEDPTFQNLIIDVINNKSDLKYLLALSDYGRNYINLL